MSDVNKNSLVEHPQGVCTPDGKYVDLAEIGSNHYLPVIVVDPSGDQQGDSVNPITVEVKNSLAEYQIVEVDDSSSPKYYGFQEPGGKWYIMEEDSNSFRYADGDSDFSTNWSNRASLSYDYPSNTF